VGNMKRAWIQIPQPLYDAAEERRKKLFLPSFTEYIRSLIRKDLASTATDEVDVKALARALAEE
jgi:Arc/MetJ-type ribon-helix-helix transcriptional regulator